MVLLFGAAAAALVGRKKLTKVAQAA
jgi:hypothetical protein